MYSQEKLPLRFLARQKIKNNDLPSQHGIKPCFREPTRAKNCLIPCFFAQKAAVLNDKNSGFIGKKRRNQTQETAVLETVFLILSALNKVIMLIINTLCVIPKTSVFRQRTTTHRQISAVRAVRIAFLLSLFAYVVGA